MEKRLQLITRVVFVVLVGLIDYRHAVDDRLIPNYNKYYAMPRNR